MTIDERFERIMQSPFDRPQPTWFALGRRLIDGVHKGALGTDKIRRSLTKMGTEFPDLKPQCDELLNLLTENEQRP